MNTRTKITSALTTLILVLSFGGPSIATAKQTDVSDHFDGKTYFNPEVRFRESLWSGVKVMIAMARSQSWRVPRPRDHAGVLPEQPKGTDVVVTFVNHATFVIQSADAVIVTDPVWSKRVSPLSWAGPARYVEPGIDFAQLKHVDVVVISHNHYDHLDLDSLHTIAKTFDPVFLVPAGDRALLASEGITKVQELDWWQVARDLKGVAITFTPAQHFSARGLFDRNRSLWGSYVIEIKGRRLFFAGDTGYASHFKQIYERFGAPDLALLPIGAYEPYWFMKTVHMNPRDAVKAHLDLHAKRSLGMHFGTFKLTTEAIDQPVKDLGASLIELGVAKDAFTVLPEGGTASVTKAP